MVRRLSVIFIGGAPTSAFSRRPPSRVARRPARTRPGTTTTRRPPPRLPIRSCPRAPPVSQRAYSFPTREACLVVDQHLIRVLKALDLSYCRVNGQNNDQLRFLPWSCVSLAQEDEDDGSRPRERPGPSASQEERERCVDRQHRRHRENGQDVNRAVVPCHLAMPSRPPVL